MKIVGGTVFVQRGQKSVEGIVAEDVLFVLDAVGPMTPERVLDYMKPLFSNSSFQDCKTMTSHSYASYEANTAIMIAQAKAPKPKPKQALVETAAKPSLLYRMRAKTISLSTLLVTIFTTAVIIWSIS